MGTQDRPGYSIKKIHLTEFIPPTTSLTLGLKPIHLDWKGNNF